MARSNIAAYASDVSTTGCYEGEGIEFLPSLYRRDSPSPYARMVAVTYIHKVLFYRGRGKPLATVSLRKSCFVRRSRRPRAEGSPRPGRPEATTPRQNEV